MNFERMRALFLDQAIRGELVPQLVEEGTVDQIGVSPEEVPFEIPESWKWIRLDGMATIVRGGSPRPIKNFITKREDGLNWIKIGDAERGTARISQCAEKIIPEGLKKTRFIQKGSLLLTNSMSFGYPYILDVDGCIHDGWLAFSDFESVVNRDYLYYALLSPYCRSIFIAKAAGAVVKNLNIDKVKEVFVPVPPLHEQARIVAKLEEAFAEIDRAEKAYEELQTLASVLRGQILQEAIKGKLVPQLAEEGVVEQIGVAPKGVPFEIPESWKWVPLSSLGKTHTGTTPSTSTKEYFGNDIPFVKPGDIDRCLITYHEDGLSSVAREVARLVPEDSLLMVCIGGSIGKVAVCDREVSFNQQINAIVCDEKFSRSSYLFVVMRSPYFQDVVRRNATGTATPIINKSRWGKLLIPLPPVEEQDRIVAKVEELLKQVDALSTR